MRYVSCTSEIARLNDVISNLVTSHEATELALRARIAALVVEVDMLRACIPEEIPDEPPTRPEIPSAKPRTASTIQVVCSCGEDGVPP